jgi:hypothetical protein
MTRFLHSALACAAAIAFALIGCQADPEPPAVPAAQEQDLRQPGALAGTSDLVREQELAAAEARAAAEAEAARVDC